MSTNTALAKCTNILMYIRMHRFDQSTLDKVPTVFLNI